MALSPAEEPELLLDSVAARSSLGELSYFLLDFNNINISTSGKYAGLHEHNHHPQP